MSSSADLDVADIPVICGPTGAGKSAVALWLAGESERQVVIISADSRQIYRGFDVGTAKPNSEEQARAAHRGIDIVDPTERYSAARWAADAADWIQQARAQGAIPVVVGGTGLYMRALFDGLYREPQLDRDRRERLAGWLGALPTEELRRWVERLDPRRAHLGRVQLRRAAEIALLTGERVSDLHEQATASPRWRPRYLLVDPGPALAGRLTERLDAMIDAGWLDEVRDLAGRVPIAAPAWQSTGYGTMQRVSSGELEMSEARLEIAIHTRQYAKRQRTWFRHQLPADAVTPLDPTATDWQRRALAWWREVTEASAGGRSQ